MLLARDEKKIQDHPPCEGGWPTKLSGGVPTDVTFSDNVSSMHDRRVVGLPRHTDPSQPTTQRRFSLSRALASECTPVSGVDYGVYAVMPFTTGK